MYKQQLYADTDNLVSAGVVAIPHQKKAPKIFYSQLTPGYNLRMETGVMADDLEKQTDIALQNIDAALKQANGGLHNIVRLSVFIKDDPNADSYAVVTTVTEVIQKFFSFARPGNMILPAQSIVFVSRLPYDSWGQLIGIEATALIE